MVCRKPPRRLGGRRALAFLVVVFTALVVGSTATPAIAAPVPSPPPEWSAELPGLPVDDPVPAAGTAPAFNYPAGDRLLPLADADPPDLDDLPALGPRQKDTYGTYLDMLRYWRDKGRTKAMSRQKKTLPEEEKEKRAWRSFVKGWVRGINSNGKGKGYEQFAFDDMKIAGASGWTFGKKPAGATTDRQPDADSAEAKRSIEVKFTPTLTQRAKDQLQDYVQNADTLDRQLVYVFAVRPTASTLRAIKAANRQTKINQARIAAKLPTLDIIVARVLPATAQPVEIKDPELDKALAELGANAPPASGAPASGQPSPEASGNGKGGAPRPAPKPVSPNGAGGVLVPPGSTQLPVDGALSEALADSPDSPEDEAVQQDVLNDVATMLGNEDIAAADPLGGVDFSTLELRYVSDTYQGGSGLQYAFSVDPAPGDKPSYGGLAAAQTASDAFFVWLELPTDTFTVNLNPDEPDRIIDDKFGTTDAGRILLQADLQMKKTVAKLIHPDTRAGAAYWNALQGEQKCLSMRQWIVPAPATVREDGNQLYILDAPLQVKLETDYVKAKGVGGTGGGCSGQSQAETDHNEAVFRATILPQVQKAVNTAPEYADLRRVYVSRVAAQWYRERSRTKHTAYSNLIDGDDVSNWPAREPWSPKDVFDQYVKSYTDGEFNVKHTTRQGNTIITDTYVFGGVDFSTIPRVKVNDAAFNRQHPGLATAVNRSAYTAIDDEAGKAIWLGGESTAIPLTEIQAGLAAPTSKPAFWIITGLPLLLWVVGGALVLIRRQRRTTAATMTARH